MSNTKYTNTGTYHPFLNAMLAYNNYDYSDDPLAISATSLMKPTNMVALERFNKATDKEIDLEALIPSVMGNAMHTLLETAIDHTQPDVWQMFGIPKPDKLEVRQEIREMKSIEGYNVSGKFDILYQYDGSDWHLADLKTMSVWALIIDPIKKKEEFTKQLSIYRWLNQDKEIADIGEILFWYTDWSKADSMRKRDYPKSRIGTIEIPLWSLTDTEAYIVNQLKALTKATTSLESTGSTGIECTELDLWRSDTVFKYYKNPANKARATKNFDNYIDAQNKLLSDGLVGEVVEVPGEVKRCKYCSVLNFCPQGKTYKTLGLIKE